MQLRRRSIWLLSAILAIGGPVACGDDDSSGTGASGQTGGGGTASEGGGGIGGTGGTGGTGGDQGPDEVVEWPGVKSEIAADPESEQAVSTLLATMSLPQKIGQMVQAEILAITPAEVKQYHIGSVLNGGGSWPGSNKHSTAADWVALADAYYAASTDTSGGAANEFLGIPVLWGTDAVHGHGNVLGATLFPHNIGLGAMNDPDLIEQIGVITAREVAVTGIDWAFGPTLAVVRDDRWGRTYEGYSEDPVIVRAYAGRMVKGLQGKTADNADLFNDEHVICTAKHFVGDGGTDLGTDQGDNLSSERDLRDIHAQGYLSALEAGAQTVMASFNSWQGAKMHGNHYLLTDILKGKFAFDGFVVGDWNGHAQVPGCDNTQCAAAINAGVDMIMVPNDWKAFIEKTIAQVTAGEIEQSRIDDAVSRILRVKMRSGLLGPHKTKSAPSTRAVASHQEVIGAADHRAVAREAVRKSLVLLKNKASVLPLAKSMKVLVAGKSADDLSNQTGGWSLTWQGTNNTAADFPGAQSIYAGITEALAGAAAGGTATLSVDGSAASSAQDVAIVVIGETPYAEGQGDIGKRRTMEHALLHPEDLQVIENIRAKAPGLPIVTVLVSGRPLFVDKELNRSDAFVAAWLPGSEGGGIADVLFGDNDFQGKLSYSWPAADCQTVVNHGDGNIPLFGYGYGLTYADTDALADDLPEVSTGHGCDAPPVSGGTTNEPLDIFVGGANQGDYVMRIGGPSNWGGLDVAADATTALPAGELSVVTTDGLIQGSAKQATWAGTGQLYTQVTAGSPGVDLSPYANSLTSIAFRVRVDVPPPAAVNLSVHCVYPCLGEVPLGSTLRSLADGAWHDVRIPLKCLIDDGLDITNINTPFLLYTEAPMSVAVEDIRWLPNTADAAPDCSIYAPPRDVINTPVLSLYTDAISDGFAFTAYMNTADQELDIGGGNNVWVGNLTPSTNLAIHKTGYPADLTAYNTATGTLKFDVQVTSISDPAAEILVKTSTSWPNVSDVRLFGEVLGMTPATGTWVPVTIPIQTLVASENDLSPGGHVDITNVTDLLVIEAVGGNIDVQLDNIRWEL